MAKYASLRPTKIALLGLSLTGLAACGLTGPLERPAPLIGAPDEPAATAEPAVEPTPTAPVEEPRPTTNELGGELPATAPVETIEESGLPPIEDDDGSGNL